MDLAEHETNARESAVYTLDLLGDEPNASLRHRLIRHLRPYLLAAYDYGQ
jgi:hypothetical protein